MGTTLGLQGNADCQWDDFDPEWYVDHNYRSLRDDDRRLLQHVRDFFAAEVPRPVTRGVDVGSGANLYPTLAMLPFCEEITLWEHSSANVKWLAQEIRGFSESWDPFWDVLSHKPPYVQVEAPREMVRQRAKVTKNSVFKLGTRRYELGTMFFVAESITDRRHEFREATHRFVGSLKPGAPFAAAFMGDSAGYTVNGHRFPAVAVDEADVERCLSEVAEVRTRTIDSQTPLRRGYQGMILACGKAGRGTR